MKDPVSLAASFAPQETTSNPTVMRLLPRESAAADEVPMLDRWHLGERELGGRGPLGADLDAVEGGLVGVERQQALGSVALGGRSFDDEDQAIGGQDELLEDGLSEHRSVMGADGNGQRVPNAVAEGET